jgi:hypothetical protein
VYPFACIDPSSIACPVASYRALSRGCMHAKATWCISVQPDLDCSKSRLVLPSSNLSHKVISFPQPIVYCRDRFSRLKRDSLISCQQCGNFAACMRCIFVLRVQVKTEADHICIHVSALHNHPPAYPVYAPTALSSSTERELTICQHLQGNTHMITLHSFLLSTFASI